MKLSLYKSCTWGVKIFPEWAALHYLIGEIFLAFNLTINVFSCIWFNGFGSLFLLFILSFTFKFCIWHRLPIYYMFLCDFLGYMNDLIIFNNTHFFFIIIFIFGIISILGAFIKNKINAKNRNT